MTTPIAAVDTEVRIQHGVLIDLDLRRCTVTGASGTGTTATLTFATQGSSLFTVGDVITVSGLVPSGYNGTYTVTAAADGSVSYANATTGSLTQQGSINQTFYISNCYAPVTHNGNTYVALAGFLNVGEMQSNISTTNDDIQVSLSAIPSAYISAIVGQPVKGGQVNIYRAFFDYNTQLILTGEVYRRFSGIITNFSIQEDINSTDTPDVTHTIVVNCSSIIGVIENLFSGRRTNKQDYQINYAPERYFTSAITTDPSMDRVAILHNASFDFGRPYSGSVPSSGTGNNTGGGGGNFSTEGLDWQPYFERD
jgi:hypothetical protein